MRPDAGATQAQFAVLVFQTTPAGVPPSFEVLADSGADLAFVTAELAIDVVTEGSEPTPTRVPPSPASTARLTPSSTATRTPTPTPTPTATATPPPNGPEITHFGLARADSQPLQPAGTDAAGRPIFASLLGQGMSLIVEARPGLDGRAPGRRAYNPNGLPDLHLIASRPLGDGNPEVCDVQSPGAGGIPAVEPLVFTDAPATVAAINDFGCRVNDGTGQMQARAATIDACTRSDAPGGSGFGFVDRDSSVQFCLLIARPWAFPAGDTVVAARVRDTGGGLSDPVEIVVRVTGGPPPTPACRGQERAVTIARPASMLWSSYSGAEDVSADPWQGGPLRLCFGAPDGDGRRSIQLTEDAEFSLRIVDGSVLCVRLEALGSQGRIDCAGGSGHDVRLTRDSDGDRAGSAAVLEVDLGADAGPGAATLRAPLSVVLLPPETPASACRNVGGSPRATALTTATATVQIVNSIQGGEASIAARGANFDCARLTETDGPGTFVLPFAAVDTAVGDTANVLIVAD